ncbi:indolethylamine N-methyltransferase-like isoform X2 [Hyperolius riggenbachi]|uniref:indolethylamine N-methyltransferase-like isoform X2 n=1 Tax=Hyperolius riggenbachi TaxID=752182 RepID=UPI0035A3507E
MLVLQKEKNVIDVSLGPILNHLLAICDFVDNISIVEFSDPCMTEMKKWLNKEPDAHDWTHTSRIMKEITGSSEGWQEREERLRSQLKHMIRCDFTKEISPDLAVLPKADCLFSIWGLEFMSIDEEAFCKNLRTMASYIKQGGYLLIYGNINSTFFKVGGEIPSLCLH